MKTVLLGDLVLEDSPICYGILMPGKHVPAGVPVVKVRDYEQGRIDPDSLLRTSEQIEHQYRRSRLRGGDILLSIRGTTGRVGIVPEQLDGANITQDSARLRVHARDRRYVYHMLRSGFVQRQIETHTIGQAVQGINIASVRKLEIPWLADDQRERAARLLDASDGVIASLVRLASCKHVLRRALLHELLTGRRRFKEFANDDVGTVPLFELCHIQIGGTPRRNEPALWAGRDAAGLPWVSIGDMKQRILHETSEYITREGVDRSNVKLVPAGTVMMSFKLTIGRVARAGRDLYTNEAIAAFPPKDDRIVPGYLECILPLAVLKADPDTAVKGATLNKAKLAEIPIRLPSVEEQQRIADVADLLDADIERTERLRDAYEAQKRALMHRLVAGDLPVSVPAVALELAHA